MAMTIEIENNQHLERLLMENPDMTRKVQAIVRKVIKKARASVQNSAASVLTNDPREAAKGVQYAVYKALLGGQVNIISPRSASGSAVYSKPRKLQPGQRGGNRMLRSERTEQLDSYTGAARNFILRWIDTGTAPRTSRYGNRGAIQPRRWFNSASTAAMQTASTEFEQMIDALIAKELNA